MVCVYASGQTSYSHGTAFTGMVQLRFDGESLRILQVSDILFEE